MLMGPIINQFNLISHLAPTRKMQTWTQHKIHHNDNPKEFLVLFERFQEDINE
jgi:hypothetical protein